MKPRRDITLGEMQDECKKRDGVCCGMDSWESCKFFKVCPFQMQSRKALGWDLTDPPRFNEAQMAFWRGCYGIGIVAVMRSGDGAKMHLFTKFETIGVIKNAEIPLEIGETLDLAELLGKDGESK